MLMDVECDNPKSLNRSREDRKVSCGGSSLIEEKMRIYHGDAEI
jgi:hypothetical protein